MVATIIAFQREAIAMAGGVERMVVVSSVSRRGDSVAAERVGRPATCHDDHQDHATA